MKGVERDGPRRLQRGDEDSGRVEAALLGGSEDRREDLLGLRPAPRAIATAAHLAGDHGGTQRVFGAPVRRVESGVEEEAEDRLEFGPEMGGEATRIGEPTGARRQQSVEALDIAAARDRQAVVGQVPASMAITRGEGGLQQRLHLWRKRMGWMVEQHRATATEQMGETRLVRGLRKLAIGRPAVPLQHATIVGAERPRRLGEAAAIFNRVDRRGRRRKGPEPVHVTTDFPAGFIGRDDGTAADGGTEGLVGRLRLAGGAMDGLHQPPAGNGEAEATAEQVPDAAERETALFVEEHGERDRLRTELHGGRAERIRRLQRMPTLHAPTAVSALADRDEKFVDDRALHGQVFLVLRDDAAPDHRPPAVGTLRRQRRIMNDVDARRRLPMRGPAVAGTRFAARPLGMRGGQAPRERRGLARGPSARHVELFFQPFVLAPQAVAFDLGAPHVLAEPFILAPQILDDLLRITRRRRIRRAPRHTPVMPDSCGQYKREMRLVQG